MTTIIISFVAMALTNIGLLITLIVLRNRYSGLRQRNYSQADIIHKLCDDLIKLNIEIYALKHKKSS